MKNQYICLYSGRTVGNYTTKYKLTRKHKPFSRVIKQILEWNRGSTLLDCDPAGQHYRVRLFEYLLNRWDGGQVRLFNGDLVKDPPSQINKLECTESNITTNFNLFKIIIGANGLKFGH